MNINNLKIESIDYSSERKAATLKLEQSGDYKRVILTIEGIEYNDINYRVGDAIDLKVDRSHYVSW
jgi:ribosomal protein L2